MEQRKINCGRCEAALVLRANMPPSDQQQGNYGVALKALGSSCGNFTCEILAGVRTGPRGAQPGFGEGDFASSSAATVRATIWITLRRARTLASVFLRTKPPGPEFSYTMLPVPTQTS